MKKKDQAQLADFMREVKPLSAPADFTELLMEQIDPEFSLESDVLTVGLRKGKDSLQLNTGINFSEELMERLVAPPQTTLLYDAVRPRRIVAGIGIVLLLVVTTALLADEPTTEVKPILPNIAELFVWTTNLTLLVSIIVCGCLLLGLDYVLRSKVEVAVK